MRLQHSTQDSRELASRTTDGLSVTLFWSKSEDRVYVNVCDSRSGDSFDLPADSDKALEVFHHPYAHAAFLGVDYRGDLSREAEPVHA